jgi:hypothetical protein
MRDREAKAAILAALGPERNRAEIEALLRPLRSTTLEQLRRLLRWLDQSGLALYFLASVQKRGRTEVLTPEFRAALESRMASNESRSADMFEEFQKVVDAFKREKVRFCAMKGFSLIPDFYPSVALRHQTDFDFLVAPESIENASRVLVSIGYISNGVDEAGDCTFATPLQHVPSATDNIYAIQRHREIDLATSVRMAIHGVTVDLPLDFLERIECRDVAGFRFPALSTGDTFFVHVLHAFRHLLGSWIRASWLLEIAYFLERHFTNDELWAEIVRRAGGNFKTQNAFGLVLSLVKNAFRQESPAILDNWCIQMLPRRVQTWVNTFGTATLLADLQGTKTTLFVHREFIDAPDAWRSYVTHRLFPFGGGAAIGNIATASTSARMVARATQWSHSARRVVFHAAELFAFPFHMVRWKLALRSIDRQRLAMPQAASR